MPLRALRTCSVSVFDHHAVADGQRAGHLHFRHFFHFDQTHAAGSLQRIAFVIAERRDLDAVLLGGLDHKGARRGLHLVSVDCELYQISHSNPLLLLPPAAVFPAAA